MSGQIEDAFRQKIRAYFRRLAVLTTQTPSDFRQLLIPPYMLYNGFKSHLYIDPSGKLGFEVYRERASRFSIKVRKTRTQVEHEIFGFLGQDNMLRIQGRRTQLVNLVLTCKPFSEKFGNQLPRGVTVLNYAAPGVTGPLEVGKEAEVKVINCSIYWVVGGRRRVRHVPFAWIFGDAVHLNDVDPLSDSESDFYSALFGRLYEIITGGYERIEKDTRSKVVRYYMELIRRVEDEFRGQIAVTKADEYVFQQLLNKYRFFLHPGAILIESQPTLFGEVRKRPDFHIQVSGNEHVYVEMEPPFYKPFEDMEVSGRLKMALKQVAEWREVLAEHDADQQRVCRYVVLIGCVGHLSKEEREALEMFNGNQKDLVVVTWDHILDSIRRMRNGAARQLPV